MFPNIASKYEALYSKCLFRTIGYNDLKMELENFEVEIKTESYYLMCLRLRLIILQKSDCSGEAVNSIKEELEALSRSSSGYYCSISGCRYAPTKNYDKLLHHLKSVHHGTNQKIVCQLNGCKRELTNVSMLKLHIKTCHRVRRNLFLMKQNQISEELSQLHCPSSSCGHQRVATIKEMKLHITRAHTDKKEEVSCIFRGCNFKTQKTATFKSHMSKTHRLQLLNDLKSCVLQIEDLGEQEQLKVDNDAGSTAAGSISFAMENTSDDCDWNESVNFESMLEDFNPQPNVESLNDEYQDDEEQLFIRALAITFNTWANINHIPYRTVNQIVAEVFRSYDKGIEKTKNKIKIVLLKAGIEHGKVNDMLKEVEDPFMKARLELEGEKNREDFLLSSFSNVQPETVRLNEVNANGKSDTMQFISVKRTLKQLLEDETYLDQKKSDPYFHEPGFIKDVRDGYNFRTNEFFTKNPEAVPLLFFQDELEVVNPLGAGKSKHKIQCTYWTSLEIIPAFRTRIKSIQLCSLVLSRHWKKYGNEPTMRNLLDDLIDLETVGLKVDRPSPRTYKAGVAVVVGDNLGQHQLAEMNSVFSSGFICRFCDATYDDVCKNNKVYSGCDETYVTEMMTEQKYNACADLAVENGEPSKDSCGIKGHCLLNQLQSFHCANNLAPCMGHDFFEGAFAYDVQFLLNHLLNKEKLMTTDEFNAKVLRFKLSSRDAKNRPKSFKVRSKYEGNSGSLRILSRILTTILAEVLEKSATQMYFIKLHEVGEIISAPALTVYEIEYVMKNIIEEYLDLRIKGVHELQMPRPRPKHHILSHYPDLYLKNGPLKDVRAMRMERKAK